MSDLDLKITLRAIDRFSEPAKKVAAISEKLAKNLGNTQKELFNIGRNKKAIKRLSDLQDQLKKTSSGLAQAKQEVAYFRRQMEVGGKAAAKLFAKDLETAKKKVVRLAEAERKLNGQTAEMSAKLNSAGINTRNLRTEQDRLGAAYARTTNKMRAMSKMAARVQKSRERHDRALQRAANATLVAGGLTRVGGRMTGALREPLREALEFEDAMADVKKVVNFSNANGLRQLSRELINLTRTIPIAKEGLAAIAAAGGQLGVSEKDLGGFVETVAKMSTAFDMLPDEAGDAMAKLSNIYQIPIQEMASLGDAINHLSNNTAAHARDIVPVLQRVGGNARQFGLSAIQAAALGDAFIALGKAPEVAGTAINAMLMKMQTATKQGNKFQSALARIGMSAGGLEKAIAADGQGALTGFLERLSKLDNQARAGVLSDLFGLEYADDISLLAGNLEKYQQAIGLVANGGYAGSMETEFKERSSTRRNRLQLMQQRWDAVQQRIGDALLPVLDRLLNVIEPIVDGIGGWIDKHPHLTQALAIMTGGIGALALAIAPVIIAVNGLNTAITWMGYRAKKAQMEAMLGGGGGKGWRGKLKGIGKGLSGKAGLIGAGIGALAIGSTLADNTMNAGEKAASISSDVGGIGGAMAGAAAGAALGSVIPVIGTTFGGIVGSIIGGMGGGWLGEKVGGLFTDSDTAPMVAKNATQNTDNSNNTFNLNVQQQPGENSEAFAKRVMELIQGQQRQRQMAALYDSP